LVKTFGPRGTVHLLRSADLPRWTAALAAVPRGGGMPPAIRLDDVQTGAVIAAIAAALADAELTVDELDDAVMRACGEWAGELVMPAFGGFWPRWRQAIGAAASAGALCFGPNRGRRVTYTGPRRWLPDAEPVPASDALRVLVHDYLHAYGPATPAHFAQWLAAPTRWARTLFAECALDEVYLDGEPAWVNAGDTAFGADATGVHLLPYFDAFAVGSHPRASLFPGRAAQRALARTQAGNFPVLLVDGEVAGVWRHVRAGRRITMTVEPLRRLSARRLRLLDDAAGRVAAILEGRLDLTIGTVTVGAHA
ncbi:MAG: DNA glycosylase AlkZ-like family protein, partial [Jatrophihabitantaceae bacterium]